VPLGYSRTGRVWTWARPAGELTHLIGILRTGTSYTLQWSVGCPPAARLLWGEGDERDLSFNVMAGVPSRAAPGAVNGWALDKLTADKDLLEMGASVKESLLKVCSWLDNFQTRRGLWTYLLENRDPWDHREFTFPANLGFKFATATALALVGGDHEGCELLADVQATHRPWRDRMAQRRLERIEAFAKDVCG
jgi:hypothetical protein